MPSTSRENRETTTSSASSAPGGRKLYVDGQWVAPKAGATRTVINPADNTALATVAEGASRTPRSAVAAARKAFDEGDWPRLSVPARARLLVDLADRIDAHTDRLAELETRNNGKPLRESRSDVGDAAACFRYYAGLAATPLGTTYEVSNPGIAAMVVREPIGVCAQIVPWNFPLMLASWKLAPGLAAGNCCILKPAEATPLTALALFELIAETGFPPGLSSSSWGPVPWWASSLPRARS